MEQLLIIEDDRGLNQGLSKALKADDRQIISYARRLLRDPLPKHTVQHRESGTQHPCR